MSDDANLVGPDVADPPVPALITTAVAEYSELLAGLNEMQKLRGAAYDLASVSGNTQARRDRKKLVTSRTWLEKRRVALNAEDRSTIAERIALRDSEADRLTALIRELETPITEQIRVDDERREEERLVKQRAAEAREAAFRERIQAIANVATRAVGMSSAEIEEKIALVTRIPIDDDFEEFSSSAGTVKLDALLRLRELHSAALVSEAAAAEAKLTRERLAQLEQENAERLAREAIERKTREAVEAQSLFRRTAQSADANELIAEIRRVQRRALTASTTGLLQLVTFIEDISIGDELGDFAGIALKAKDDALTDLHEMHEHLLERESDQRTADVERKRIQDEQAAAQRRIDEATTALAREVAEVAEQRRAIEAAAPQTAVVDDPTPVMDAEFSDPAVDGPVFELIIPLLPAGDALALAEFFHATYERLAPSFGYETKPEIRAFDPTSANGRLMVAVCQEVLAARMVRPVCEVDC